MVVISLPWLSFFDLFVLVCVFGWFFVCLFVCLRACLLACLLVCWLAGWLVCLFVCLFVFRVVANASRSELSSPPSSFFFEFVIPFFSSGSACGVVDPLSDVSDGLPTMNKRHFSTQPLGALQ